MAKLIAYALFALLAIATFASIILLLQTIEQKESLKTELAGAKSSLLETQGKLNDTKAELAVKKEEIRLQQEDISDLRTELNVSEAEVLELEGRLNESEEELEQTKNTLSEATEEIDRIRSEALAMDEQINESISWFKDNSALPSTLKTDRFVNKVEKSCVDEGTLNLGCVSYLMEEDLGFMYKNDPTGDRLYSIDEIITRRGGDCEDYSLFFKALLSRFADDDLEIEAWTDGIGRYVIFEDTSTGKYWYYDNTDGKVIGNTETSNPYAVCYFYGMEGDTRIGHCVIMLTNATISSPEDISDTALAGAEMFEPQDGHYLGRIGKEFFACSQGDEGCDEEDYHLTFVITDSDLFQFSDGKWNYYEGRHQDIGELLERLDKIELD
ncbi:MAG: hypothetical protein V1861_00860 [Candidatus Micrarchaeota archaeon]